MTLMACTALQPEAGAHDLPRSSDPLSAVSDVASRHQAAMVTDEERSSASAPGANESPSKRTWPICAVSPEASSSAPLTGKAVADNSLKAEITRCKDRAEDNDVKARQSRLRAMLLRRQAEELKNSSEQVLRNPFDVKGTTDRSRQAEESEKLLGQAVVLEHQAESLEGEAKQLRAAAIELNEERLRGSSELALPHVLFDAPTRKAVVTPRPRLNQAIARAVDKRTIAGTPELVATALDPSTIFAAESAKIDGAVKGSAGISAPASAKEGEPFFVYLRVQADKLAPLLQGLEAAHPENTTRLGKDGVGLTPKMVATVGGFGFEVTPKAAQPQAVSAIEATTWEWQVKPTESGLKTLTFKLAGTLTVEGKEVGHEFYVYNQPVQVTVSPTAFVTNHWQWLVTTLVVPIAGALWALLRKRLDDAGARRPSILDELRTRRRARVLR